MSERDEREMIEKNMSLSIEFSKYIFEHPECDDKIPKGAQVVLFTQFNSVGQLSAFNRGSISSLSFQSSIFNNQYSIPTRLPLFRPFRKITLDKVSTIAHDIWL